MNWKEIVTEYDNLQQRYGDKNLGAIISGGKKKNPDICFIFMNPTSRNIAASKDWNGPKSPWIGTKIVWRLFVRTGLFSKSLYGKIKKMKPVDWDEDFAEKVYKELENNGVYITNLAKCTQVDARKLPDKVFKKYRRLLFEELELVNPKKIVTFGNQVSSIVLERSISVSKHRRQIFEVEIRGNMIPTLPVYYPVGQGLRNIDKAVRDTEWLLSKQ